MWKRKLRARTKLLGRSLVNTSGLWTRGLLCWILGIFILLASKTSPHDLRFNLRGPREVPNDIVVVELSKSDLVWQTHFQNLALANDIRSVKEIAEPSDGFFWDPQIWMGVLSQLEKAKARAAVVTLFFSTSTVKNSINPGQAQFFMSPFVLWAAKLEADGQVTLPALSSSSASNVGLVDFQPDSDGKVRSIRFSEGRIKHMVEKIAERLNFRFPNLDPQAEQKSVAINFQGPYQTYKTISFQKLYQNKIPESSLRGKIVIFGSKDLLSHVVQTPLGPLTRGELVANVIDNFQRNLWVQQIPFWIGSLILLGILFLALIVIFQFPQTPAFIFLVAMVILEFALSAALFDLTNIWLSAEAPFVLIIATYVIFTGYRLGETERARWEVDKEREAVKHLENLKTNFISLISHDLKTPLAKIQGIADRLLTKDEKSMEEGLRGDITLIRRTSDELKQYIGSILQLTRVEAKDFRINKVVTDFNELVEGAVNRILPLAKEKNISFETNLEPLFSMELDQTLISEVVLNLVENAIKYTDNGGKVRVASFESNGWVHLEVEDTGGGIPHEEIEKVFTKFYRGSSEKTMKVTGTGLGLYLVKYFIELHQGQIFIESQIGMGTKIGFKLPIEVQENDSELRKDA